jgi:sugar lactone lactonase YvrE
VQEKSANTTAQSAIAALMILGMLACLGVVVYAGNEINRDIGPNALAVSPDGRLYVASHGKVHVFSSEIRRETSYDLETMGASRIPADIAVHSDGRLFVADPKLARLLACDVQKSRCGSHDMGLIGWTPAHLVPGNTFKFSLDEARGRIYVSDNGGHRLLITDATGKILSSSAKSTEVVFPNQVQAFAPGELTVADTNHNRIVTFDVSGDRVGKVLREFPVAPSAVGRPGRVWPFGMVRLPDGSFWVMAARNGMKDADITLFDVSGKPLRRMDLGPDSDPFAIALWKDAVVVGDARNYRLHAFQADGTNLRAVRDPAFEAELRQVHAKADAWRGYRFQATIAMIAFPIVGVFVLWRMGVPLVSPGRQPIARPVGLTPSQLTAEPRWLPVEPEFAKVQSRSLVASVFILVACFAAMLAYLYFATRGKSLTPVHILTLVMLVLVALATVGASAWIAVTQRARVADSSLGVSLRGLHLRARPWHGLGNRVDRGPFAWSEAYFDGRRLFAGGATVVVKAPMGPEMFAREELEREVLSRIPAANFVSAGKLGVKIVKSMPLPAKVVYGALLVVLLITFLR